jgi:hypothetical protein
MLLVILIISLVFASYREGLTGIKDVNKEAPSKVDDASKSKVDASKADASKVDASKADASKADASKADASKADFLPKDGILLGKPTILTVAEITKTLKNNPGVQNLIDNQKK